MSFNELGNAELKSTADLFKASEVARRAADDAGLIMSMFAADIEYALKHIPVMNGRADRKARRVARHAKRAAEQLRAVRESMRKIPEEFNRTYAEELAAVRARSRPRFDIKQGA